MPVKTKESSRIPFKDEEAGASPVTGASFIEHEEDRNPPDLGSGYTRSVTGVLDQFPKNAPVMFNSFSMPVFQTGRQGATPCWRTNFVFVARRDKASDF